MIAAIFGLSPTVLAILAAVCSPRLGICALHGQVLYFAGLLLYSPLPLGVTSIWLVPFWACVLFFCGCIMGLFMVRPDINPESERGRLVFTAVLVLANFLLLLLLLHSVFGIMCFRLDEALHLPAVRRFTLVLKLGSGGLAAWLALFLALRRRRLALAAIYAELGLIFSTFIVLMQNAGKVTWPMPANLQRALQIKADMEYFTIAVSAEFAQALYFVPPLVAALCGVLGFFLLRPQRGRAAGVK